MSSLYSKDAALVQQKRAVNWDFLEPLFRIGVLVFGVVVIAFALKENIFFTWKATTFTGTRGIILRYLLFFSGLIFVSSLVVRTWLWFRYRPIAFESIPDTELPHLTVAVPAYNEGAGIYRSLTSIVNSDYPADRLDIIAIDDGSRDDTWVHMKRARDRFPGRIRLVKFDRNRGKREGIYHAFHASDSPYFITVDSDTRLEPTALKGILAPLILRPEIAAATGRIRIDNYKANIFTRMLNAHFAMAFDFTRAVQTTFTNVLCLSGAFSAYRRSALSKVIDQWREQTFLNQTCTYGEDRSLTNHILRGGHGTVYQQNAVCHTMVPEQPGRILRMLTRWARSNLRESAIFSGFMFNARRRGNRFLPFFEFSTTMSLILLHFIWFYFFLFSGLINSSFLFRALSYTILFGFFYMLYYIRIEGHRDFPYVVFFSLFSAVFMVWIFTVAAFTLTRRGWSTR